MDLIKLQIFLYKHKLFGLENFQVIHSCTFFLTYVRYLGYNCIWMLHEVHQNYIIIPSFYSFPIFHSSLCEGRHKKPAHFLAIIKKDQGATETGQEYEVLGMCAYICTYTYIYTSTDVGQSDFKPSKQTDKQTKNSRTVILEVWRYSGVDLCLPAWHSSCSCWCLLNSLGSAEVWCMSAKVDQMNCSLKELSTPADCHEWLPSLGWPAQMQSSADTLNQMRWNLDWDNLSENIVKLPAEFQTPEKTWPAPDKGWVLSLFVSGIGTKVSWSG